MAGRRAEPGVGVKDATGRAATVAGAAPLTQGIYHDGAADVFVPHVRHTFLGYPPDRLVNPPAPRAQSVPAGCTCDPYARDVHVLMFKNQALPRSAPSGVGGAAAHQRPRVPRSPGPSAAGAAADAVSVGLESSMATEEMSTDAESSMLDLTDQGSDYESNVSQAQLEAQEQQEQLEAEAEAARELRPLEEVLLEVPRDEDGLPTSLGSLRHGLGDCRPCAYFGSAQRPCLNGVRCLFCHLPHSPKRRIRLCRRKRLEMRAAVEAVVAGAGEEGVAAPPRFVPISWSGQ